MGDAFEDLVMVAGSVVGAQLERDDAEDDVEDTQDRDADQALHAKGEEVLEQVLAGCQARADDDSHVGEGDREVLLGHRVLPVANVSRGRGLLSTVDASCGDGNAHGGLFTLSRVYSNTNVYTMY